MKPATKKLHQALIRSLRGILTAWENWLTDIENERA